jgi:hypothetical protein
MSFGSSLFLIFAVSCFVFFGAMLFSVYLWAWLPAKPGKRESPALMVVLVLVAVVVGAVTTGALTLS